MALTSVFVEKLVLVSQSVLLSPCITFIPATMITWFMSYWGITEVVGYYRIGHLIHLIIKIFLCYGHSLVNIHEVHKYLHIFVHSICLFPSLSCHKFSNHVFFKGPDHPGKILVTGYKLVHSCKSGHFSLQVKCIARCTAWHSVHWVSLDILFPLSFRGCPKEKQLFTLCGNYISSLLLPPIVYRDFLTRSWM